MTNVFVDTSAWYSLINSSDAHHTAAKQFVQTYNGNFTTTNYVVVETTNLVLTRLGAKKAVEWLKLFQESQLVEVLYFSYEQHERVSALFADYAPRGLSFTDCSSILIIREQQLSKAFCFDRHFIHAGIACIP